MVRFDARVRCRPAPRTETLAAFGTQTLIVQESLANTRNATGFPAESNTLTRGPCPRPRTTL